MDKSDIPNEVLAEVRRAALAQLSYQLVHDLRTTLSVIQMSMEVARNVGSSSAEAGEALNLIAGGVQDANAILTNLIDITRESELERSTVRLDTLLSNVTGESEDFQRMSWSYEFRDTPPTIECDPRRLQQVFRHLIQNAVTAMHRKGEIQIRFWRESASNVIEVADTGPGVPPDLRTTLFDPFVTTKPRGTGLGLTYCRSILRRHGGSIALLDAPAGATFRLELPRQK